MNSKCYRRVDHYHALTWFDASNDCLSRGGSLAVFTDIGRPSESSQLNDWLGKGNTYWIGLIRSWWKASNEGGFMCFVNNVLVIILYRLFECSSKQWRF